MSHKESTYTSRSVDKNGIASYSEEENQVWHTLISRQMEVVKPRACEEYLHGIQLLDLPHDRIPQCPAVSKALEKATGWKLEPVTALIPFDKFFHLLATRRFPAATFIRRKEDLDYLQEPDIFHEIFGHCPLLTNPAYAEFTCMYGKLALNASKEDRAMLARLYWFTIEFGLIKNLVGTRVYGGGILSSKEETIYSLEHPTVQRKPFDALTVLRTPYRIDIKQPIYYVIDDFDTLYNLTNQDLIGLVQEARELGEFPASYSVP